MWWNLLIWPPILALRLVWRQRFNLPGDDQQLNTLETEYAKKGVYAFGQTSDKTREVMGDNCKCIWVDTSWPLTKLGCEREMLLETMENCAWQLLPLKRPSRRRRPFVREKAQG